MTGNTNKWRKPLAGLAAVATLATMGLVAGTANAAVTVEHDDATINISGDFSNVAAKGESYADVIATSPQANTNHSLLSDYQPAVAGVGSFSGYKVNGKFVPLTGQVKKGDKITVARDFNKTSGVKLHFTYTATDGTPVSLGSVWVAAQELNGSLYATVNPAQLPYDAVDGYKLDFKNSSFGDLTSGAPIRLQEGTKRGDVVDVSLTAAPAYTLTVKTDNTAAITSGMWNAYIDHVVYPGAIADNFNSADGGYVIEVAKGTTYDPASLIADANIILKNSAPAGTKFGIKQFNTGLGAQFTATTEVTGNLDLWPVASQSYTVTFKNGDETFATQDVVEGQTAVKPSTDPSRNDGSVFQDWYQDKNNNGKLDAGEKFNFGTPITGDLTLLAWFANGGSHTVTYKFADGKTADKTETYLAKQDTVRPADPTREGWIFAGWYADENEDGNLNQSEITDATGKDKAFAFGSPIDENVTLIARWLQADDATLEAALRYVDGGDESFNGSKYDGLFTDASFKAYVATYQGVQKKYAQAKNEATAKNEQIPAETFTSLLNELVAAWQKLEFVHEGTLTTADTTVYRLYNSVSGDHFYTQDVVELKRLQKLGLNYTNEGRLFQTSRRPPRPTTAPSLTSPRPPRTTRTSRRPWSTSPSRF